MALAKRVVFVHHSRRSESSVEIGRGVAAATTALGCELTVLDPDFDQAARRRCVEEILEAAPDLVVAAVVAAEPLGGLFDEVAAAGIPWIEAGARQRPHPGLVAQVVPDEDGLAGLLDAWLLDELARRHGADAPVELGAWTAPALGAGLVARDRRRAHDLAAHPHVTEVLTHEIALADLERDVRGSTLAALERHPRIAALWQTCEPCVGTQAAALDELGLDGRDRPLIAGFYSNPATRRLVAEGRVDGLVQVDTSVQGLVALDLAVQHWTRGTPWPGPEADPLTAYDRPLGRPWMITRSTVGEDPDRLVLPGDDPIAYFHRRWQAAIDGLRVPDPTEEPRP